MRFGLSLPIQHPVDDAGNGHQERLGILQMGFRLHWPGLPHPRVMQAIALLGERVLLHFA